MLRTEFLHVTVLVRLFPHTNRDRSRTSRDPLPKTPPWPAACTRSPYPSAAPRFRAIRPSRLLAVGQSADWQTAHFAKGYGSSGRRLAGADNTSTVPQSEHRRRLASASSSSAPH